MADSEDPAIINQGHITRGIGKTGGHLCDANASGKNYQNQQKTYTHDKALCTPGIETYAKTFWWLVEVATTLSRTCP